MDSLEQFFIPVMRIGVVQIRKAHFITALIIPAILQTTDLVAAAIVISQPVIAWWRRRWRRGRWWRRRLMIGRLTRIWLIAWIVLNRRLLNIPVFRRGLLLVNETFVRLIIEVARGVILIMMLFVNRSRFMLLIMCCCRFEVGTGLSCKSRKAECKQRGHTRQY